MMKMAEERRQLLIRVFHGSAAPLDELLSFLDEYEPLTADAIRYGVTKHVITETLVQGASDKIVDGFKINYPKLENQNDKKLFL